MPSLAGGSSSFQSGTTVVNVNSLTLQDISANRITGNWLQFGTLDITSDLRVPNLLAGNVVANLFSVTAPLTTFTGNANFVGNASFSNVAATRLAVIGNTDLQGNLTWSIGGNNILVANTATRHIAFHRSQQFNNVGVETEMWGNVFVDRNLWVGGWADGGSSKIKLSNPQTGFDGFVDWGIGGPSFRCGVSATNCGS